MTNFNHRSELRAPPRHLMDYFCLLLSIFNPSCCTQPSQVSMAKEHAPFSLYVVRQNRGSLKQLPQPESLPGTDIF